MMIQYVDMIIRAFKKMVELYQIKKNPVLYAKSIGVEVGERVKLISIKPGFGTFGSEPYLVEIGNDVTIAGDVQFITHDGGVWVFNDKDNENYNKSNVDVFGKIKIGSNVFVGFRTILMPNIEIGDNVVIGAGAVVTRNVPSNTVAVGVPAKVIQSIDEYKQSIWENPELVRGYGYTEKRDYLVKRYMS